MAPSPSDPSVRPEIGDGDLLAAIHTCGSAGDVYRLRECVRQRTGFDLDASDLADRLDQLHRAGYVRRFQPHERDIPCYRLTQIGIERLDQSDTGPPAEAAG